MIKKLALIVAAATSMFTASEVNAEESIETEVSVFSRHVWRGAPGPSAISIQPSVTMPVKTNIGQTEINIWGQIPIQGDDSEYDFSITQDVKGYASIGVTSYYYNGPFLKSDSHDIELSVSSDLYGINVLAGRFVSSDSIQDDTYIELGYSLGGINLSAGAGDGAYSEDGSGFKLVNTGLSFNTDSGYGASLIYNPDTENAFFVVSKTW